MSHGSSLPIGPDLVPGKLHRFALASLDGCQDQILKLRSLRGKLSCQLQHSCTPLQFQASLSLRTASEAFRKRRQSCVTSSIHLSVCSKTTSLTAPAPMAQKVALLGLFSSTATAEAP